MLTKTKVLCIATLLCLLMPELLNAQTAEQINHEKYWNYRDRFRKWFVKIGDDAGEGIQFKLRDPKGANGWLPGVNFNPGKLLAGDSPANMGEYLAVLSTEYKLLRDNNQDYTSTLNELYYAAT